MNSPQQDTLKKDAIEDDLLKSYRGKWKILGVLKDGSSGLALNIEVDTEEEANFIAKHDTEAVRMEAKKYPQLFSLATDGVSPPYAHQVSHFIAMPVGGA